MNTLVLNVGSSSIKYSVFKNTNKLFGNDYQSILTLKNREECVINIIDEIKNKGINIDNIGHRIVHGKEITKSCILNNRNIKIIEDAAELAPLHNIPELEVVRICEKYFKNIKQFGVFDTSFYSDMPEVAKMYGLPYRFYKDNIRRYGFHGTSHRFISKELKGKVITCHLGNGASITAIKDNKAIDTSMGFTPLEGLIMGTRCGDIDASIIEYLVKKYDMSLDSIFGMLNKESGLLGISGVSNDLRDVLKSKTKQAKLAYELYVYKIVKYIGSYVAALNGVDTIVFTAGCGENQSELRFDICKSFKYLGLKIDDSKNLKNDIIISSKDSKVKIMVIKTNEELMIVNDVIELS